MAEEILFPDGTYSGTGWSGTGSNISEGIAAADGNEISSDSDGEGDVVTIDMANVVDIVDADTITNVSIVLRGRVTTDGGDESFEVDLVIGGTGQGAVAGSAGELTNTHQTLGSRNTGAWNSDWTVAQLNGMQVDVVGVQGGMPTANTWHIDTFQVVITYTPGSGSPYSLPADPGTFTLTGAAATLLRHYPLDAEFGSFVLTGTAATLLALRELDAEFGSFVLTGTAADLLALRKLPCDPGTFALTGTAATLLALRKLPCDPGTFALTGTAADLGYADSEWDREVRDREVVTAVVRTSPTVVTITFTAAAGYDIAAQETVTATIPAAALTGATELVATPTFTIDTAASGSPYSLAADP